jgi:hypothetical protein
LGLRPETRPLGEYELAIVLKSGSRLGPQPTGHDHVLTKGWSGVLLSGYAKYSCEHVLKHGDTGGPLPPEFEPLRHILFVEIGDGKLAFEFLRKRYGLLLMVLITESEFEFKQKEGTDALLRCLRAAKIFPFSDPERTSVV